MMRIAIAAFLTVASARGADVLIVADEVPAMQTLARELGRRAAATSEIVAQDRMPAALSPFRAVLVYIHRDLAPAAERAFIGYARSGGRLILLHHSISSGKRKNQDWLPFLRVELPDAPFEQGGYKYFDAVDFDLVNAAPSHPVMQGAPERFSMPGTEVYLNHALSGRRTTLLGIRFTDPKSGRQYEQPSGGWHLEAGKGDVFYFMAGHKASDFEHPAYARIIANAVRHSR